MTCESDEGDCTGSCCRQEIDAFEETQLPRVVNVMPLSVDSGCNHNSSREWPRSSFLPESPTLSKKRNTECSECYVALETLPGSLVQAAANSKILVSSSSNATAAILKSCSITGAVPVQMYGLPDWSVKTEPYEPVVVEDSQQASAPCPTTQQNSVALNLPVASHLFNDAKRFCPLREHSYMKKTVSVTNTVSSSSSLHTDTDGRSDISVILLNSAQLPKAADSAAAKQPQDLWTVVQSMLQRQNISPLPLRNNDSTTSVLPDENEQQRKTSCPADDADNLRKMLRVAEGRNAELETKLKAEQEKVGYLLAEVNTWKNRSRTMKTYDSI